MPIRIRCRCGKALVASRRHAGKTARCPKCKQRIRIPEKSPQPRPARPATASSSKPPPPTPASSSKSPPSTPASSSKSPPTPQKTHQGNAVTPEQSATRGIEHDPGKRRAVAWLATLLAFSAIVGSSPVFWQLAQDLRNGHDAVMENWMAMLLLLSGLELAYATYLFQLPDWSSVRVVTLVATFSTAPYAGVLGIGLRARQQNPIVQWLGLAPQLTGGRALAWCLLMVTLTGLTALIAGRLASHWYRVPDSTETEETPSGKPIDDAVSATSAGSG